jgi:hypothetical protein
VLAPYVALSLRVMLALQAPAVPPAAAGGDQTILWFRSTDAATVDARALLDAVAVYTRDLGLTLRTATEPTAVPADAPSAGDAAATLRAQGARLGFWCEMRPGADIAVLTVVAPDGHLELHLVERTGAHEAELYRAIALKLRSVLVGTATPEPVAPPPGAPTSPPASPASPPDAGLRAQSALPVPARRVFLTVGYRFSTPFDSTSFRHALALDGALAIGRRLELDAGTELATRLEQQVTTGAITDTISIFDWPITLGARLVRRGDRFTFGGGAFAALHLRWASATGTDGMEQSSFAAGAGAGAELLGRIRLSGGLAGELRVYAEVPVPKTRYTLRDVQALDVGPRAGVGLGVAFPAP